MPTIFSHAVSAAGLGHLYPAKYRTVRFWVLAVCCAMLPDADVLAFAFGIPYGSMLGHRGLTHSLFFAAGLGFIVATIGFRDVRSFTKPWWGLVMFFAAMTASHVVLDALTDGGLGVAFFAPFDGTRYFFPWRPIRVSPIASAALSARGLETLVSEIVWIWIPSGVFMLGARLTDIRKRSSERKT